MEEVGHWGRDVKGYIISQVLSPTPISGFPDACQYVSALEPAERGLKSVQP